MFLRTGIQWKAAPREYGSSSNIHRWFQILVEDGFFVRMWSKGLEKYDEIVGIDWEWQSIDGCITKAPLGVSVITPPTGKKMGKT